VEAIRRRRTAGSAFLRAVEAVRPGTAVRKAVREVLVESGREGWKNLVVVGAGKAAQAMAEGLAGAVADARETGWAGTIRGIVVSPVPAGGPAAGGPAPAGSGVQWLCGGHPLPDAASAVAGRAMLDLMASAGPSDVVVGLLSGGASALMALPAPGITQAELAVMTGLLLGAGATIAESNAVRTHLSAVAGGRLGVAGHPGRTVVLVVSDVVGDDLSVIGSAPFHGDGTTYADALETLRRLDLWDGVPEAAIRHLRAGMVGDRPENQRPDDPRLSSVEHHIVCRNLDACRAMVGAVEAHGYRGLLVGHALQGEARWLGVMHAGLALGAVADGVPLPPPCALVSGGEATVTVRGEGRGGRNQESCLAAVPWLEGQPITFLSAGTDGIDGNTPAAGAVVDGGSMARARASGVNVTRALRENDSGGALAAMGDALITGPTGTNVADVRLLLIGGLPEGRADG
jgi:hydroxypyruvate reductase